MSYKFEEQSKSARNAILAKLKAQVAGADYEKLPEEPTFEYAKQSREQLLENFVSLLKSNHAEVLPIKEEEIGAVVVKQLQKRKIDSLLYNPNAQYANALASSFGASSTELTLLPFDFNVNENKLNYFNDIPASITSSRWAIAETGTIVLWPTPDEPRTMSLVPPVHFVIADADTLHSNFASLVEQQNWKAQMPTNVLLISGPSKTADIQQTLAFGAHGPKELIVLLLNSQ